ncbi:hypothetical protein Tco_0264447 [Tanacetum coccineum]
MHEENFQVNSNPLFEFDDNFKSSTINPLFDEMEENVEIKNSNVSDEPVLLNTPLSDKVECFAPEDNNDEIDDFLAMEVSSNFEEGYFDSEGDVTFLDNLLSDDASHNLASEMISDHEPEQNESSIIFSPRSDPLHHEFAGEPLTLPARNDREFEEYLSLMTVLCEISTSQSQGNVHANQNDLIPPGVENDDSEDEVNESPNLDHQDDPSIPRPPPEPPDVEKCFEPEAGILIIKEFKGVSKSHDFMTGILHTLPTLVSDLTFISSFFSFENEDTIFDPGIVTFLEPVAFSMAVSCSKCHKEQRVYGANKIVVQSMSKRALVYTTMNGALRTDISKITRKPSKTGKHGHENGRVYKSRKPKPEKVKSTVNSSQSWSTKVNKTQNVSK